jgi:hypothetical protein
MDRIIFFFLFSFIYYIYAGSSNECVICAKMMPVCDCFKDQTCVIHKQTCKKCAYAECIDKQSLPEGDKSPPLGTNLKSVNNAEEMGSKQKNPTLPPIPFDITDPKGVLIGDFPSQQDEGDCLICAQTIPSCNCPNHAKCLLMRQTCHRCSWMACLDVHGCIINCPTEVELCKNCFNQDMKCFIRQPENCRECGTAMCRKKKKYGNSSQTYILQNKYHECTNR